MFKLHYDTRLDRLADALAALLASRDPARMLEPQVVLVPQPGLQRWLVQRLAERHGIAANLAFMAPAQLVWCILRAEHPELPELSSFDREVLRWRVLAQLQRDDLPPALADLAAGEPRALRRYELAGHMAGLYERYQGYRRGLLRDWEAGREPDDPQAELWRRLTRHDARSRSRLLGEFLDRHGGPDAPPPPGLPDRLFAFGVINVSPDVLRVLGILGRHCDLHFLMPTPCREYWGDVPDRRERAAQVDEFEGGLFDEPPNPLLVSLGAVGRDFVAQLFTYDEVQPDVEAMTDDEPPRASLLERVQADVITLAAPDPKRRAAVPDPEDRSVHVHVCHSPLREVQVLHDQLLDLLQHDPGLQPRDIAVMVPDLARYAPCVDAVFGAMAPDDPRRIPWTVADRPDAETHALVALFLRLLDLPASRLTAGDVLETLAVPAVLRSFGLEADVLETLAETVYGAGIRWGEDAADRKARGLPAYDDFSWRFGRRRLLLGYMSGDAAQDTVFGTVAPITDVEGADAAALGAVFAVQRLLRELREAQQKARAPGAWQALLHRVLDQLVQQPEGRDEDRALETVRAALQAFAEQAAAAGFGEDLDWMTVRACLQEHLRESKPQQRFLAGGVSVCGLVPLRNVPFKVICILGLDADAFPRRAPEDALDRVLADRLAGRRMRGDRSVREDDRYLFLQTLMAAGRCLYLSYTGIDMRSGSDIEPSVVLSEFLDTVCEGYFQDPGTARKALVTRHPMQPFSQRLFDAPEGPVFTYRREWLAAAVPVAAPADAPAFVDAPWPAPEDRECVELAELQRFFRNPAAAFLQRQAGLALPQEAVVADAREPLVLDGLQQHQLESALVDDARDGTDDAGTTLARMRAKALLPPLDWGREAFDDTLDAVAPALAQWQAWRRAHPALPARRFRLDLGGGRVLEGVLDDLHEGGFGRWVGKASSATGWIRWWLDALVVVALDGAVPCLAWGRAGTSSAWPMPLQPAMPDAEAARALLADLLDIHRDGLCRPLPLPLRTAFAYAEKRVTGNKSDAGDHAARARWEGGRNVYAERSDPWFALAFRARDLFADADAESGFNSLATRVYVPLCTALAGGHVP